MSAVKLVSDVVALDPDIPVPAVKGVITSLYDPTSGQNARGPYSFQNGELKSGGKVIRFTLKDRETLPKSWRNKEVYFLGYNGQRGWTGVKTKEETYEGKTRMVLWVTSTAEIVEASVHEGGQPGNEPAHPAEGEQYREPEQRQQPAERPTASRQTQPTQPTGETAKSDLRRFNEARVFVGRRLTGINICVDAAVAAAERFAQRHGEQMPLEWCQAIQATLFISGDKAGLWDDMPVKEPGAPAPKQQDDPTVKPPARGMRSHDTTKAPAAVAPPAEPQPESPIDPDDVPF